MIDLDFAAVPRTVNLNGTWHEVVAAVYRPGGDGMLDSHIVVYPNGNGQFNVHYLVHDDDAQKSFLHQGSYDLSFDRALREMYRRTGISTSEHVEIVGR
jgi:hypothetical protein